MANLDDVLVRIDTLTKLVQKVSAERISGAQVYVVGGLSDISQDLGLVVSGEFRSGKGIPGQGFTGVRIGYPGFIYVGKEWHIVGAKDDVLQFGLSAEDGSAYFGSGHAVLDQTALVLESDPVVGGGVGAVGTRIIWVPDIELYPDSPLRNAQFANEDDGVELRTVLVSGGSHVPNTRLVTLGLAPWDENGFTDVYITNRNGLVLRSARLQLVPETGPASKTISGGMLTLQRRTCSRIWVETEGAAATDDLETITFDGNITEKVGTILIVSAWDGNHTVVVKNAIGNIKLAGSDFALDEIVDTLMLVYHHDGANGYWLEVARSNNG